MGPSPSFIIGFPPFLKALLAVSLTMANELPLYKCPQYAVADRSIRVASFVAAKRLEDFEVAASMRRDVFESVVLFRDVVGVERLTPEVARFVEKTVADGTRNGDVT
jgi:hypothetical protein